MLVRRLTIGGFTKPISELAKPMRRRIRDQNDHLHRILCPLHVKRRCERRSLCLWSITPPRGDETGQVFLHDVDVRGESKLFGYVGLVLWRVITERNEPESDEVLGKVFRGRDLVADVPDGFTCRVDIGPLASSCILEKDDVARIGLSEGQGLVWARSRPTGVYR